ncbi:aldo/keto reductase [Pseudomonadales bacterium]|jgi:NDP-hexose 2,3-enoyl reductase|nr:aldo/keto reductase [Gammaproteobacteria bacterium]MBT5054525.1 aldo/keto reductase [Gammaproteobacteria bacterium]MBT7387976.1 aldo/keto reductase [Gammaproteobacteria bacterium]MDB4035069.1 aldo/keto reductase [Pseudomonadales bacterium]MDC1299297.1 aldo/keto reductase [Pseudomonadales bacterium]
MQYRSLGRSALKVSELALGTMNLGTRTPEAEAFLMLNQAVSSGINFVDTADQYGGHLGVGATESLLGRWLAEDPSRREGLVLASKVYEPMSDDVNNRGLSARHIVSACEASLKRLGVETIDLYQMHHIDRSAPLDEIWQAMDRLITQGKIIYVGSSNFPGWGIAQTNERRGFQQQLGLVSEQSLYNLFTRHAELEVIPACQSYGIGLLPWSPLAGGLLAGPSSTAGRRQQLEAMRALHAGQLEAFEAFCAALGMGPSIVALAWLLQQPAVASVMIGPSSVTQLEQALTAGSLKLDVAQLARLDEIFPPMGPAPEAYAW